MFNVLCGVLRVLWLLLRCRYSEIPRLEALVAQADAAEQQDLQELETASEAVGAADGGAEAASAYERKGPMLGDTVTEQHVSVC